jgi:hypothetical protein
MMMRCDFRQDFFISNLASDLMFPQNGAAKPLTPLAAFCDRCAAVRLPGCDRAKIG